MRDVMLQERITSAIGDELARIRERFEQADRRLLRAGTYGDAAGKVQAEADRQEALGDHFAAAMQLADLGLLLLRYAAEYRPNELRLYLTDVIRESLAPDLQAMAEAITRLEERCGL